MAYMSQENKAVIAAQLKAALQGSGLKYSLSVRHYSTLVMKIQSGPIDWCQSYNDSIPAHKRDEARRASGYLDINPYWYHEHFSGKALELLKIIMPILNQGNHDRSDITTDYFDVGWYVSVKIGAFDKPYQLVA
jgi:hypothetical protein